MPWEPLLLGMKFEIRLADLQATDFLECVCPQCRKLVRVAPWQLHARWPAYLRLIDIERHMVCRRCGYRGPQPWSLWRAHPPIKAVEKE